MVDSFYFWKRRRRRGGIALSWEDALWGNANSHIDASSRSSIFLVKNNKIREGRRESKLSPLGKSYFDERPTQTCASATSDKAQELVAGGASCCCPCLFAPPPIGAAITVVSEWLAPGWVVHYCASLLCTKSQNFLTIVNISKSNDITAAPPKQMSLSKVFPFVHRPFDLLPLRFRCLCTYSLSVCPAGK